VGEQKLFLTLDVYYTMGSDKSTVYEDANDGYVKIKERPF
jgi:alpha-glucosidase